MSHPETINIKLGSECHMQTHTKDQYLNNARARRHFTWLRYRKSNLQLPQDQLSHVLRHTFASHFMMNGGNILVLQRLLGHSTLAMTMRYAHMAPDHLQEAKTLNPLARLKIDTLLTQ